MIKRFLTLFAFIFVLILAGAILLSTFPELQPVWQELKDTAVNLYNQSSVRYGTTFTVLAIVAIFILVGSSK